MVLNRRVSRPYLKTVNDVSYYIPVLQTLRQLLTKDIVYNELELMPSCSLLSFI